MCEARLARLFVEVTLDIAGRGRSPAGRPRLHPDDAGPHQPPRERRPPQPAGRDRRSSLRSLSADRRSLGRGVRRRTRRRPRGRGASSSSRSARGRIAGTSGIGLAICKSVVEAHGGTIAVRRRTVGRRRRSPSRFPSSGTERARPDRLRVLVIEDERPVAGVVDTALSARGATTSRSLANGREGLDLASDLEPDMVILDLGLPDLDGIEVCRQLRRWSPNPIIVLSADGAEDRKVARARRGRRRLRDQAVLDARAAGPRAGRDPPPRPGGRRPSTRPCSRSATLVDRLGRAQRHGRRRRASTSRARSSTCSTLLARQPGQGHDPRHDHRSGVGRGDQGSTEIAARARHEPPPEARRRARAAAVVIAEPGVGYRVATRPGRLITRARGARHVPDMTTAWIIDTSTSRDQTDVKRSPLRFRLHDTTSPSSTVPEPVIPEATAADQLLQGARHARSASASCSAGR